MKRMVARLAHLSTTALQEVYKWAKYHQLYRSGPCLFCDEWTRSGVLVCEPCLALLPFNVHCCHRCALPLPPGETLCGGCLAHPPPWERVVAPFVYGEPISDLIWQLKYRGRLPLARVLGLLLAEYAATRADRPQLLLPMPLHPTRLRQRGYNQALELARPLARALALPVDSRSCLRHKATAEQRQLPLARRAANLRNAFSLAGAIDAAHVVLLDDVMTTGHTARALTELLRAHGVQRVDVWVIARALRADQP